MNSEKRPRKLSISLAENGMHSLTRGIQSYNDYSNNGDSMLLKDSIMALHHGVELLMKQILVNTSPYLIFQDLKDAADKQIKADTNNLAIFFMDNPPKTVSYEEAINRIQAFVKIPELEPSFVSQLKRLNRLRNQLEHYAIDADVEEITKLIDKMYRPLIDFFEKYIPQVKSTKIPSVEKVDKVTHHRMNEFLRTENEVYNLMLLMKGQTVPGYLFGMEGQFILPSFSTVSYGEPNMKVGEDTLVYYQPDIVAEGLNDIWIVEVKGADIEPMVSVYKFLYEKSVMDDTTAFVYTSWLVFFSTVPDVVKTLTKEAGVLITTQNEWYKLKELLLTK